MSSEQDKQPKKLFANDYCKGGPYETAGDPNDHDVHVILYHWKSCPPCIAFKPEWGIGTKETEGPSFLEMVRSNPNSRIYASTCESANIPSVDEIGFQIESYPTIMFVYDGKIKKYENRPRTAQAVYEYALELVNKVSKNNLYKKDNKNDDKDKDKNDDQCGGSKRRNSKKIKKNSEAYYKYKYHKYKTLYLQSKKLM